MMLNEIVNLLFKKKKTIAVAESCTGGLISHALTNISGSSKYFKLGLVVYSNESKSQLLKINLSLINQYGAVSREVALLMAERIKNLAKTHIGIATTGIAGPTGGTKNKPVGTVYIALSCGNKLLVKKFQFKGTRIQIKIKTKDKALFLIKQCLLNS